MNWRSAVRVFRKEGLNSLICKGSHVVTFRLLNQMSTTIALSVWDGWRRWKRIVQLIQHTRNPDLYANIDPEKRIVVNPSEITYRYDHSAQITGEVENPLPRKNGYIGIVRGGDWDRHRVRIDERDFYRALEQVYKKDGEWNETVWYNRVVDKLERGKRAWNCKSQNELEERKRAVDKLHDRLQEEGYKSQQKLVKEGVESFPLSDPVVNISREGEFIHFRDGNHRLALAKILDLDEITVQIGVRHSKFQKICDEKNVEVNKKSIVIE